MMNFHGVCLCHELHIRMPIDLELHVQTETMKKTYTRKWTSKRDISQKTRGTRMKRIRENQMQETCLRSRHAYARDMLTLETCLRSRHAYAPPCIGPHKKYVERDL